MHVLPACTCSGDLLGQLVWVRGICSEGPLRNSLVSLTADCKTYPTPASSLRVRAKWEEGGTRPPTLLAGAGFKCWQWVNREESARSVFRLFVMHPELGAGDWLSPCHFYAPSSFGSHLSPVCWSGRFESLATDAPGVSGRGKNRTPLSQLQVLDFKFKRIPLTLNLEKCYIMHRKQKITQAHILHTLIHTHLPK